MAIVVTGATGNVGRPLVSYLHAAGAQVRAVTRSPQAAGFPDGVDVTTSTDAALSGATAVFLNSRALIGQLKHVVNTAKWEGVQRLVALSAINVDDDFSRQPSRVRGERNKELEQLVIQSRLEWAILRSTVFATNFAGMWAPQIRAGDIVRGPFAAASTAPIAENDIAAVAAHALLTDDLVAQHIPLTGPEAFTNAELVEVIGTVLNRPLRYQEIPGEAVRDRFVSIGLPAEFADAYIALLSTTIDQPAIVTPDIEKILGRPAQPFAQWVAEHRERFTGEEA
jgi:uncharacterized protein YbjT (DUF2867 family)